jgi:hypothetical protein
MSNIYSLVDDEQWKPVWGFPGYEISSHGRCVSHWKMRGGKDSGGNYIDESYTLVLPRRIMYMEHFADLMG